MDVITFGEAMVRLAPPNFRRLEQARAGEGVHFGQVDADHLGSASTLGHADGPHRRGLDFRRDLERSP